MGGIGKRATDVVSPQAVSSTEIPVESPMVINEQYDQILKFNVMQGRLVSETLHIQKYCIEGNRVTVSFNRTYKSEMEKSPSHLIFISALIQFQKIIYIYLCNKFSIEYEPSSLELFKIWPTITQCQMPRLIRDEQNIEQIMTVHEFVPTDTGKWLIRCTTEIESAIQIYGEALVLRV